MRLFTFDIEGYVKGKKWYWYALLWALGFYLFVQLLHFNLVDTPVLPIMVAQSLDFTIHEFAHILTGFLPSLLTASAGSFSELLLGAGLVFGALRGRAYFALLICALWFMLACQGVGIYMADAVPQRLPLVSLGGALSGSETVIHDWHFVFGKLHLLGASAFIGGTVRVIGDLVGLAALSFTAWLLYKMAAAAQAEPANPAAAPAPKRQALRAPMPADPEAFNAQKPIYPIPKQGLAAEHPAPVDEETGEAADKPAPPDATKR